MPETKTKIIDGESFQLTVPYAEGHVLNAAEAKTLNQVRLENIANNWRDAVKEAKAKRTEGDQAAWDKMLVDLAEYDEEYTFALGGGTIRRADPVEREAYAIAKDLVKAHIAEKYQRKMSEPPEGMTEEAWKEKVDAQIDTLALSEKVMAEARKRVQAKQKFTVDLGDSLAA